MPSDLHTITQVSQSDSRINHTARPYMPPREDPLEKYGGGVYMTPHRERTPLELRGWGLHAPPREAAGTGQVRLIPTLEFLLA
jgi:hypothetical protein